MNVVCTYYDAFNGNHMVSRVIMDGSWADDRLDAMMDCYNQLGFYPVRPFNDQIVTADQCIYQKDHYNGFGVDFARDFNDNQCVFEEPEGKAGETWRSRIDNAIYIERGDRQAWCIKNDGNVEKLSYTLETIGKSVKDVVVYLGRMGENLITVTHLGALVMLNQRMTNLENNSSNNDLEYDVRTLERGLQKARKIAEGASTASQRSYYELKEKIEKNLRPKIESSILDVRISEDKKRRRKPNFKY